MDKLKSNSWWIDDRWIGSEKDRQMVDRQTDRQINDRFWRGMRK